MDQRNAYKSRSRT